MIRNINIRYNLESTLSPTCKEHNAVFICTVNTGLEIQFPESQSITFSFGMFFHTTQTRTGPGSVIFRGEAVY